jgi:signal transduction histidine kinase
LAERLFEPFFSTKAEGLGIGLNICRSIVEFHKGRLTAENDYNSGQVMGCIFRVTLPLGTNAAQPQLQTQTTADEELRA